MALTEPIFVIVDPAQEVADTIAFYEAATGKTLQPGQPERLVINALAYRISLLKSVINDAALRCLVAFASFPELDYLGELLGVVRLPEQPAKCNILFTFISSHGAGVIPSGTRVSSQDSLAVFATTENVAILATDESVTLLCEAVVPGKSANGYLAGDIAKLIDTIGFVDEVANIDTTAFGEDQETDENLRIRIKLAPEAFSVAGPTGAYKFFAKSADQSIIDVAVTSPVGGQVWIYPLIEGGGTTPQPILDAVYAACNDEKVRPTTDTVLVISPTVYHFDIDVQLTLYNDANVDDIEAKVEEQINAYVADVKKTLGKNIVVNQIIKLCMVDGVYNASVVVPNADVILQPTEVGFCDSVSINTIGYNDG